MSDEKKSVITNLRLLVTALTALVAACTALVKATDKRVEQASYETLSQEIVKLQKQVDELKAEPAPTPTSPLEPAPPMLFISPPIESVPTSGQDAGSPLPPHVPTKLPKEPKAAKPPSPPPPTWVDVRHKADEM
jgi:hypothetical protein